jgi:hypothetical protein
MKPLTTPKTQKKEKKKNHPYVLASISMCILVALTSPARFCPPSSDRFCSLLLTRART